jgi:hypothetical protein
MPFVIKEETIQDGTPSTTSTWSSVKIDAEIPHINDTTPSTTLIYSSSKTQALIDANKIVFRGAYNASTVYAVNDLVSYSGSSWRRLIVGTTGTTPVEGATWTILAQKGDQGIAGESGLSSSIFDYRLDRNTFVINTGTADGTIRFNNSSLIESTIMWIDHLDESNRDVERFLQTIPVGSRILIQDKSNSPNYVLYQTTGSVSTVAESHVVVPIAYIESSGTAALVNNHQVLLGLQYIVQSSVAVGTTTTLLPGNAASVVNSGTSRDLVLDFSIPRGFDGQAGANGQPGAAGTAATIAIGTVSTGAAGSSATVVNSGTSSAAVFDFSIPRGDTGSGGSAITAGYPFNPIDRFTTTITTGNKAYMYVVIFPTATVISGFHVYVATGADSIHVAVYRNALRSGNSGTITLCGESTAGVATPTAQPGGLPNFLVCRRAITAVSGQNLNFASGELATIAFHSNGTTNSYLCSPTVVANQDLAWSMNANYGSTAFPSVIGQSSIQAANTQRLCFELY